MHQEYTKKRTIIYTKHTQKIHQHKIRTTLKSYTKNETKRYTKKHTHTDALTNTLHNKQKQKRYTTPSNIQKIH